MEGKIDLVIKEVMYSSVYGRLHVSLQQQEVHYYCTVIIRRKNVCLSTVHTFTMEKGKTYKHCNMSLIGQRCMDE